MSTTDNREVKPLEECSPPEVWPQSTSPREVYLTCMFHGTHKVLLVPMERKATFFGVSIPTGVTIQPVSEICNPSCGAVFLAYLRDRGPECHCLDGMPTT